MQQSHWSIHSYTSRLDYCNGLLFGIPNYLINHFQCIQNAAARLVTGTPRSSHITPVLHELHWLPVLQRIRFKLALLTFKVLNGLSPTYLSELLTLYTPSRTLRSANRNLLAVKSFKLKKDGGRSFVHVAPTFWNCFPDELRTVSCLMTFKKGLKTILFTDAYSHIMWLLVLYNSLLLTLNILSISLLWTFYQTRFYVNLVSIWLFTNFTCTAPESSFYWLGAI